jgi:hypothetical protein
MSALGSIVAAVRARLVALGYTATDKVFDFDNWPSSVAHKAFRIEVRGLGHEPHTDNKASAAAAIDIYIVYAMRRSESTAGDAAIDDRETIENDILTAASILNLSSSPLLFPNAEASSSKERDGFLVSRLSFTANYLRDYTP